MSMAVERNFRALTAILNTRPQKPFGVYIVFGPRILCARDKEGETWQLSCGEKRTSKILPMKIPSDHLSQIRFSMQNFSKRSLVGIVS